MVILELRGAQVAERGVQPASVVDLVNEAGIFAPNHLRGHRDRSDGSPCPAARTPRPATPAYIWHAPSPPQACAAGSAHAAEDLPSCWGRRSRGRGGRQPVLSVLSHLSFA